MIKQAAAGAVGLGLVGGVGAVTYDDSGTPTVTVKDKKGREQSVRLTGEGDGKGYDCPRGTTDKLKPHDRRAGRIKITLRQVGKERRSIEAQYPGRTAPAEVAGRYNALVRRHNRLVTAFNSEVKKRNAVLEAECDPA